MCTLVRWIKIDVPATGCLECFVPNLSAIRTLETPSIVINIDRGVLTDVARYAALGLKIQTPTIHVTVRAF